MNAKQEQREIALERRVTRIDAAARDAGHELQPWQYETTADASLARTRCPCGADAAVRIEDGGTGKDAGLTQWQGGRLTWKQPAECRLATLAA